MDIKDLLDMPPWDWPRDAGKMFLRILIDRRASESDRLAAAEMAGAIVAINDHLADALLDIAGSASEPDELRAKAAISLGPVLETAEISEFDEPDDVPITEPMFHKIQTSLQKIYGDRSTPKEVRRRVLEASVRAPETWHEEAIRHAWLSGDQEWVLTAVFAMRRVRGFDAQILAALESADPEIHFEAVLAAGAWALDAAWSHVAELVNDARTPKPLRIAAIGAASEIRSAEARNTLQELADSEDEEIAEAAVDAIGMAEADLGLETKKRTKTRRTTKTKTTKKTTMKTKMSGTVERLVAA